MNKAQIIGIGIFAFGVATYFLTESNMAHTISGVLCAIGFGFIFKWISFRKQTLKK